MPARVPVAVVLAAAILTPAARAEFVPDGSLATETFAGSSLDVLTWESFESAGSSITQNNGLTFAGGDADYTARGVRIPVGSFARATVQIDGAGFPHAAIFSLTSNTAGTAKYHFADDYSINLTVGADNATTISALGDFGNGTSASGQNFGSLPITPDNAYVLEISRDSATAATYRVFHPDTLAVVAQYTRSVPSYTDPLFLNLSGGGVSPSSATYTAVTIPLANVPEPAVALTITAATLVMRSRRRRR